MDSETLKRKVFAIKNTNLQTALRLQMITGMRISEIGQLQNKDINLENNTIIIDCKAKKGSFDRTIIIKEPEKWLYDSLSKIKENRPGQLFYKASTLKKYACKRGIKTNDLKKLRAKELFYKAERAGLSKHQSTKYVQGHLGHKRIKNTKIYIESKSLEIVRD